MEGQMEARDADAVIQQLRKQGHLPVNATAAPRRGFHPRLFGRRGGVRLQDLALAMRELVMLLAAGQTLEKSLHLLAGTSAPETLRPTLAIALERLRGGATLADALEEAGGFPPLTLALIRAGEAGGALETVLAKLADLLERSVRLRESLLSALIYPAVLVTVAVASVVLLLAAVVPQFAPLFANAPHELPFVTRLVLAASTVLRNWGTVGLAAALALLLGLPPIVRRMGLEVWRDRQLLRLPGVGDLVVMAITARLCRILGVLLKSGVALPAALGLVRAVAGNHEFATLVDAMQNGVKEGHGLAGSLPANSPLPPLVIQLLRVGEHSGHLEDTLIHLADIYDAKVEQSLKRLLAVIEPACVLALSAVIGGIVISILLAVVSINDLAF